MPVPMRAPGLAFPFSCTGVDPVSMGREPGSADSRGSNKAACSGHRVSFASADQLLATPATLGRKPDIG